MSILLTSKRLASGRNDPDERSGIILIKTGSGRDSCRPGDGVARRRFSQKGILPKSLKGTIRFNSPFFGERAKPIMFFILVG